ncbi:hypothetical protein TIFTF001_010943 [Ficus carica]|uniref:Uncharacterized protein n=1 Tax=Ficus carica TaxID=3494 RepID=A0AA87ZQW7_FICCA|nr:hypothetical protein TIFTF001_010943 [Ficus carica]
MAQIRPSAKLKKKSLCEKSMPLVANIMKLSSLSFVTLSFRTPTAVDHEKKKKKKKKKRSASACTAEVLSDQTNDEVLVPERSRRSSQRSEEPESASKPLSYLMEPKKGSPLRLTGEKEDIDDRAADFIRRTREKIKKTDLNNSVSKCFFCISCLFLLLISLEKSALIASLFIASCYQTLVAL